MKRRFTQDTIVLAALLLLLIGVCVLISGHATDEESGLSFMRKRTTYSTAPTGVKALYDTLQRLHYPVTRQLSPLTTLPGAGVLFMLDPQAEVPVSSSEWDSIRKWVSAGNLLVTTSDSYFEYVPGEPTKTTLSHPTSPSFLSRDVRSIAVPRNLSVGDNEWTFVSETPTSALRHMQRVKKKESKTYPLTALFGSSIGPTVSFAKCGNGGILVLCEAWSLTNEGLASKDNLNFVLDALAYADKGKGFAVTFDEYHHGYGAAPGISSLIGTSAKLGLAELFLAFLLLILAVSRSFGRPIPLRESFRPRSEYLYSMSMLLQRAKAVNLVRNELDGRFIEEMDRYFGLHPTAGRDVLLQAAERRSPEIAKRLRQLLNPGDHEATSEMSILALEARRNQFRKELQGKS